MTSRHLRAGILIVDLIWSVLAMAIGYLMHYGWIWHGPANGSALVFAPALLAWVLLWCILSSWIRLDGFGSRWLLSAVVSKLSLAVMVAISAVLALAFLMQESFSRLTLGFFSLWLVAGLLAIRIVVRSILSSCRTRGLFRKVVIVGNGPVSREMVRKIQDHPEMLREVVGFLTPGDEPCPEFTNTKPGEALILSGADVAQMLASKKVDEIVLTVQTPSRPEILDLTTRCTRQGIAVSMVPQPYELYVSRHEWVDLDGVPLLQLLPISSAESQPGWKRGFDLVMTLVLLPLCMPALLAGALALRLKKGRAFCTERRCGRNGKEFDIYRLNSPRCGTCLPRYERLLQNLSITELPQLINVLRGEMSLVGPRPEGVDRAFRYTDWHRLRLMANPGITGLAQVNGLRDQHSSEDKTRYDLRYILDQSLVQDISLLLQTAWTLTLRLFQRSEYEASVDQLAEARGISSSGESHPCS